VSPEGRLASTARTPQGLLPAFQRSSARRTNQGGQAFSEIFRLYGDINGDGTVAASDFIVFRQFFGGVNAAFDFDGDGSVSASDFIQFRLRFGGSI
jgi:hypothetical protein